MMFGETLHCALSSSGNMWNGKGQHSGAPIKYSLAKLQD